MNTTASAQGNAAAQLYVLASAPPDENPFKNVLTNEEIERHAYFNDDILEHAEEIDELEAANETARRLWANMSSRKRDRNGGSPSAIARREEQISELEDRILAELEEVRTEYRDLAEALHNGRENYVEHYANATALTDQTGVTREYVRRYGLGPGPQGEMVYLESQMSAYEATYNDYKLIEQGFKYNTTREVLVNLVWGAIAIIAVEIATAGIAKFVAIGAYSIRATKLGQAAIAAERAGAALITRFTDLTERTRRRVVDVVRRGRRSEPEAPPSNGDTVTDNRPRATTTPCRSGTVVACGI